MQPQIAARDSQFLASSWEDLSAPRPPEGREAVSKATGPGAVASPDSLLLLPVAQGTAGQRPPVLRALIGRTGRALIGCGEASRAGGNGGGGG